MKFSSSYLCFWFIALVVLAGRDTLCGADDPTHGFTYEPLTEDNRIHQKQIDIHLDHHDRFKDEVFQMWDDADDKFCHLMNNTLPDYGIRITGLHYSSGAWQFEGYFFLPGGTAVVEIQGMAIGDTTTILRTYDFIMKSYPTDFEDSKLYEKLFKINMIHDVDEGKMTFSMDDKLKFPTREEGPGDMYYDFGVHTTPISNLSIYMETTWRDEDLKEVMLQIKP